MSKKGIADNIYNISPISDFYNPDGTLKPYEERKPIFLCEAKDGDSEETIKRKRIIADFLNKTYTQEMDDKINKKIIRALLFGSSI